MTDLSTNPDHFKPGRTIRFLTLGFLLFLAWVIYLADTGGKLYIMDLVRSIPYGDKLGHFALFGLLTLGANLSMGCRRWTVPGKIWFGRLRLYRGATIVTIAVVLEECSQYFLPRRTFDLGDLAADMAGILLFCLITKWFVRLRQGAGAVPV
ncbi:VanZ family protein [Spongorhabdus nitratireducens]